MKKMFYIMGKSATGKDTIYQRLLRDPELADKLQTLVPYTTRPMREGEANGREYFFKTDEELKKYEEKGIVAEKRVYHTTKGDWSYFTIIDESFLNESDIITIGTVISFLSIRETISNLGMGIKMIPIYIEVEEGERLIRAIKREKKNPVPNYDEICRRTLEDAPFFRKELLEKAGINTSNTFLNHKIDKATCDIKKFILSEMNQCH